jgi:hypothetical protein
MPHRPDAGEEAEREGKAGKTNTNKNLFAPAFRPFSVKGW